MAAVAARRTGSRRRTINEINMVPFIDVMLVLLIIFMVCAPLMTPGLVDLPSVGQAQRAPDHVIEVIVEPSGQLRLRPDNRSEKTERVILKQLAARVLGLQGSLVSPAPAGAAAKTATGAATPPALAGNIPVVISADKGVQYEAVVKVMDTLQRAGIQRVGLAVRTTGSEAEAR